MIEKMTGRQFGRNEDTIPQQEDVRMPKGYSINEFGEIIRPAREEKQEQVQESIDVQPNETKLSLKQRVAQFLQKNNVRKQTF